MGKMRAQERQRLSAHLTEKLREIGVDWERPNLPSVGPITILEQYEWPPYPMPPQDETDGLVCVNHSSNNEGSYQLHFTGFYLLFFEQTYGMFSKTAIHEGAHVMEWYERMQATGNKFTAYDLEKFQRSYHGTRFSEWNSRLLEKARQLGYTEGGLIPSGMEGLFGT